MHYLRYVYLPTATLSKCNFTARRFASAVYTVVSCSLGQKFNSGPILCETNLLQEIQAVENALRKNTLGQHGVSIVIDLKTFYMHALFEFM